LEADTLMELLEDHIPFLQATMRYASERMYQETLELPAEALHIPFETMPFTVGSEPLDLVERMLFLRTLRVFKNTNLASLATMSPFVDEVRVPKGTTLWSTGEMQSTSLMLVSGEIACAAPDGRRFRYGPGTVVGGVDGLAARPRWYDAETATDIVALQGRA